MTAVISPRRAHWVVADAAPRAVAVMCAGAATPVFLGFSVLGAPSCGMRVKAVGRRSQPARGRRRRIEGVQGRRRRTRCTRRVVGLCTCSSIGTRCPAVATRQIRVVGWVQTVFTARSRPKLGRGWREVEFAPAREQGGGSRCLPTQTAAPRPESAACGERAPQGAPPPRRSHGAAAAARARSLETSGKNHGARVCCWRGAAVEVVKVS